MKRKLIAVALVLILAVALSGCCLKHDMKPATCTEPSTCAKCGKTEGEPLGHTEVPDEAVEPTCTETGLTEGSHCSVCGEVLTQQQTVDALGHDWKDPTVLRPKTCDRCGAEEGEPLGARYFMEALLPQAPEEDADATKTDNAEEADRAEAPVKSGKYDYVLTGSSYGFDAVEPWLTDSSLTFSVDHEAEAENRFGLSAVLNGSEPLSILFASDFEGVTVSFPGLAEGSWYISLEDLMEMVNPYLELAGMNSDTAADLVLEAASAEDLKAMGEKYLEIFFSVANADNTTEELTEYELKELGEKPTALKIVCNPTQEDWQSMLKELFTTAAGDEQLLDVLEKGVEARSQNMSSLELEQKYGISSLEELRSKLREYLETAAEDTDAMAESMAGTEFEIATGSEKQLYAVKLRLPGGTACGFESFKKDDGSAQFALSGEFAGGVFRLVLTGPQESRTFRLGFDGEEKGFAVDVSKAAREENLVLDTENLTVLKTMDEIMEALGAVAGELMNTDFFAKIAEHMQ